MTDLNELTNLLRETAVFSAITADELAQLSRRMDLRHYALGQAVCRAGDQAEAFYVVYGGRARVVAQQNGEETTVGLLTRGQSFGEQGLLSNTRRRFTVRAASDLAVLHLGREDFERFINTHPAAQKYFRQYIEENEVQNFLKLCTVFASLPPAEIRALLSLLKKQDYPAGATIIREGEAGDALYIIRTGQVKIVKDSAGGKVLNRLGEGAAFGELALLTGETRAASVVATEPTSVFRLDKDDFARHIATSPKLRQALIEMASGYGGAARPDADATDDDETLSREELPEAAPLPETARFSFRPPRRLPALLQLSEMDCGAACLAMILRYYGKFVSINRLRDMANVTRDGATLHSVAGAAENLGFHSRGVKAGYEALLKVDLPAIAHWEGYHYIVLYEATPGGVIVADPARGLRKMSREQFEKGWSGYLLLLEPTPRLSLVEESKTTFGRFLPMLKPYRMLLAEIFLASLVIQLFGLASPIFTQVIVDKALVQKSASLLNIMLVGMLLVAFFESLTSALRYYLLTHTTRRIDMQMVVDFYRHLLSLPMRYFEERKVGDIIKRFGDNARIRDFLTGRALSEVMDWMMIFV